MNNSRVIVGFNGWSGNGIYIYADSIVAYVECPKENDNHSTEIFTQSGECFRVLGRADCLIDQVNKQVELGVHYATPKVKANGNL